MNEDKKTEVDETLYVNEATLELLRRRIESDVKRNFLRSIGLPIGAAGILAILYMLFIWIPYNVGTLVLDNPQFREQIRTLVEDNPQVREQIKGSVTNYLKQEEGVELISGLVKSNMATEEVKDQIRMAVDDALEPAVNELSSKIEDNLKLLVSEVEDFKPDEVRQFVKGPPDELREFLASPEAEEIRRRGMPLVLTKVIRRGWRFERRAIEDHIDRLEQRFKDQFQYVIILDRDHEFLALIQHDKFLNELDDELMALLNAEPDELTTEKAKNILKARFGERTVTAISTDWIIGETLVKPLWRLVDDTDTLAAIDNQNQFVGLTSREKMIDAIVSIGNLRT